MGSPCYGVRQHINSSFLAVGRIENYSDSLCRYRDIPFFPPFLFSLLLLIAATAIAYKMDDIVLYAAQAGTVTAHYLFIALVVVMAVIALGIGPDDS